MTSHNIDTKHPDMKFALDTISEAIKDAQQRRDYYKKMSPKQRVLIHDRFGAQVFDADQMVWLYTNEHDTLQKLYATIYELFTVRISGRPKAAAVAPSTSPSSSAPSPDPRRE